MKRKYILLLDAGILALIPVVVLLAKWMLDALPDCFSLRIGLLCPACGGTRCLLQMVQGHFGQALKLNPYFFFTAWILLGLLVLGNVYAFSHGKWGGKLLRQLWQTKWVIVWAIGFALFGVFRNLVLILG